MLSKNTLKQFREFRTLKKNKEQLSKEQYFKELQMRLDSIKADISAPDLSETETRTLFRLLGDKESS